MCVCVPGEQLQAVEKKLEEEEEAGRKAKVRDSRSTNLPESKRASTYSTKVGTVCVKRTCLLAQESAIVDAVSGTVVCYAPTIPPYANAWY